MGKQMVLQKQKMEQCSTNILSARTKSPVRAICLGVKTATERKLICRKVKQAVVEESRSYDDVVQASVGSISVSERIAGHACGISISHKNARQIQIQEKKAQNISYKNVASDITIEELFSRQEGKRNG
ncbi:MAG: hypothetical protein J5979_05935 [Lachnospiraceae bacterium]|nr:hypothetical protein [Lachnospiraceae bacterium]